MNEETCQNHVMPGTLIVGSLPHQILHQLRNHLMR